MAYLAFGALNILLALIVFLWAATMAFPFLLSLLVGWVCGVTIASGIVAIEAGAEQRRTERIVRDYWREQREQYPF